MNLIGNQDVFLPTNNDFKELVQALVGSIRVCVCGDNVLIQFLAHGINMIVGW